MDNQPQRSSTATFILGVAVALAFAAGWAVILASGNEPRTTIVEDLPGGVWTEVVAGALVGALVGAWQARPADRAA